MNLERMSYDINRSIMLIKSCFKACSVRIIALLFSLKTTARKLPINNYKRIKCFFFLFIEEVTFMLVTLLNNTEHV